MLVGVILERHLSAFLRGASLSSSVLATIALSILLEVLRERLGTHGLRKILSRSTPAASSPWHLHDAGTALMLLVTVSDRHFAALGAAPYADGQGDPRDVSSSAKRPALVASIIDRLYTLTFAIGAGMPAARGRPSRHHLRRASIDGRESPRLRL